MTPDEAIALGEEWIDAGVEVFPVALRKTPTKTEKRPLTRHGHQSAVLDKTRWRALVDNLTPKLLDGEELGVGGHLRDHVLFDFDVKNGARGDEIRQRFLAQHGDDLGDVAFRTISGGTNWILAKPEDKPISNHSPWSLDGVDIRADAGWFVVPGTTCSWGSWDWISGEAADIDNRTVPPAIWSQLRETSHHEADPAGSAEVEKWLDVGFGQFPTAAQSAELAQHLDAIATSPNRHPAMWDALVWVRRQGYNYDRRAAVEAIDQAWRSRMAADGEKGRDDECRTKLALLVGSSLEYEAQRDEEVASGVAPVDYGEEGEQTKTDYIRSHMLTPAQLREVPRPKALVEGYFFVDSLAWIIGPSGAGKSFVAIDLALRVASGGGEWHGRAVEGGKVLYMIAEGLSGMSVRQDAWCQYHGVTDDELDIVWLQRPIQIADAGWSRALADIIGEDQYDLIVIDTLARATVGVEENSAQEAGIVIANLEDIRHRNKACVLLVHHTGKDPSAGGRGSSAFKGALESEVIVTKAGGGIKVTTAKQKSVEELPPMHLHAERVEIDDDGPGIGEVHSSLVYRLATPDEADQDDEGDQTRGTRNADVIVAEMKRISVTVATNTLWQGLQNYKGFKIGKDTLKAELEHLARQGFVIETEGARRARMWSLTDLGHGYVPSATVPPLESE